MTKDKLRTAMHEARRFLTVAAKAEKRLTDDSLNGITGCKETGAAKRASMDLTRALADLRKG